eukprot:CAMPEP_0180245332 /NCGR_PEP_ID=MMETSP0987-20121128/34944_1 /TAXON_ID=697907 /ORGANISM="non described non described, Strain CCMP2293" /LENGTH=65 /DNA_ID=CAMNT_0022212993 /DNA_START=17 /DNA_END=210 /DNA_ORIENTATION=+
MAPSPYRTHHPAHPQQQKPPRSCALAFPSSCTAELSPVPSLHSPSIALQTRNHLAWSRLHIPAQR